MEIKRDDYLNKLIRRQGNGLIKIVTGIRRCGKSYLLFNLFHDYLVRQGVDEAHMIEVALDNRLYKDLRDPDRMLHYIMERITDQKTYYIILDEVQLMDEFEDVLNSLLHIRNADVYVTGSNSRFLSSDVITEFRGRGDEIRVYPLSFREYTSVYDGSVDEAWDDYFLYGGLPLILTRETAEEKAEYLSSLFEKVYLPDIIKRHRIRNGEELDELVDILASAAGSLTSPVKLSRTFRSAKGKTVTDKTLKKYMDYLQDAFLIRRAVRYDIKGRKYINSPAKYYFEDVGLRNVRLNFRQVEENHIMENIIFNEMRIRGYQMDVGVVEAYGKDPSGKTMKKQLEVDFVANQGSRRYYLQSAYEMSRTEKEGQEKRPLLHIDDSFKKIVLVKDRMKPRRDEQGIVTMGIREFLLDSNSLES